MKWESADDGSVDSLGKKDKKKDKKEGKKGHGCLIAFLVVVAVCVVLGLAINAKNASQPFTWPTSGLATQLPKPESSKGAIEQNSSDMFKVEVAEVTADGYWAYVDACKAKGYTVDAEQSGSYSFEAFSEKGYHLDLRYNTLSQELRISLEAPVELGTIAWPASGPASLVPAPGSKTGLIDADRSTYFEATVGEVTPEAFAAYCDEVAAAGFTVDYSRDDTLYRAKNSVGDSVTLTRGGFNTMTVAVTLAKVKADEDVSSAGEKAAEPSTASESQEASEGEDASVGQSAEAPMSEGGASTGGKITEGIANAVGSLVSGAVDPDFKAMIDSYEASFDEYIAFMQKYESDDGSSSEMLGDYASVMQRYAETLDALNAVDANSLSAADAAYYTASYARIMSKLDAASV